MDFKTILFIVEIVVSVLLVIMILMQQKGSGLGNVFGGGGGEVYRSKRGAEKFLYNFTIVLAVIFVANSVAIAILSS